MPPPSFLWRSPAFRRSKGFTLTEAILATELHAKLAALPKLPPGAPRPQPSPFLLFAKSIRPALLSTHDHRVPPAAQHLAATRRLLELWNAADPKTKQPHFAAFQAALTRFNLAFEQWMSQLSNRDRCVVAERLRLEAEMRRLGADEERPARAPTAFMVFATDVSLGFNDLGVRETRGPGDTAQGVAEMWTQLDTSTKQVYAAAAATAAARAGRARAAWEAHRAAVERGKELAGACRTDPARPRMPRRAFVVFARDVVAGRTEWEGERGVEEWGVEMKKGVMAVRELWDVVPEAVRRVGFGSLFFEQMVDGVFLQRYERRFFRELERYQREHDVWTLHLALMEL
ncbi:hypothetical protein HDU96_006304 [Phlyctochytrium bullatum]|nr:hypothetical protein HDU96_006304 [Phlyctochytrium bullatum]